MLTESPWTPEFLDEIEGPPHVIPARIKDSQGRTVASMKFIFFGEPEVERRVIADSRTSLMAFAPDHALYAAAVTAGVLRWEPWTVTFACDHGPYCEICRVRGEACVGCLRYSTSLDEFGVPLLRDAIRTAIREALHAS